MQSGSNHLERGGGDQIGGVYLRGGGSDDGHAVARVHGVEVRVPGRVRLEARRPDVDRLGPPPTSPRLEEAGH